MSWTALREWLDVMPLDGPPFAYRTAAPMIPAFHRPLSPTSDKVHYVNRLHHRPIDCPMVLLS